MKTRGPFQDVSEAHKGIVNMGFIKKSVCLLLATSIMISCSTNKGQRKDSIYNQDNYTLNPTSAVFSSDNGLELFLREKYDVDIIPTVDVDYYLVGKTMQNRIGVSFRYYTYADDLCVFPSFLSDSFLDIRLVGQRFGFQVIEDQSALHSGRIEYHEKYGAYSRVNLPLANGEILKDVLISPMAFAFLQNHDYKDSRKLVFVLIENDEYVKDDSLDAILFDKKKKVVKKTGMIYLISSKAANIITDQYSSIHTDNSMLFE